jgi:ABC-type uncharacterized transport system involved in gliding motility auxiliary subunit
VKKLLRYGKYGSNAGVLIIAFGAILVIGYLVIMNHTKIWDLTKASKNTLDPKTINVLKSLDFDVTIKAFLPEGGEAKQSKDVLDLYKYKSDHIRYEIIDPDVKPNIAKEYNVERYGQAVLIGNNRKEPVGYVAEETITNAILKLKMKKQKTVYYITGHGEKDVNNAQREGGSFLRDSLVQSNYTVKTLMLVRGVPADADLVILAGPEKPLFSDEVSALKKYLATGGSLFVCIDPQKDGGIKDILSDYGIILSGGIIIDKYGRMMGGDYMMPVVNLYGGPFQGFQYATIFPGVRALEIKEGSEMNVQWLARTSDQSWAEMNTSLMEKEGVVNPDGKDKTGPLNIGLLAIKPLGKDSAAKIVIFGDSDFVSNNFLLVAGNKDLAMNSISMLLGDKDLVIIEKKASGDQPFVITPIQGMVIFWIPIVVVPLLILGAGIAVYFVRRRG